MGSGSFRCIADAGKAGRRDAAEGMGKERPPKQEAGGLVRRVRLTLSAVVDVGVVV